MSVPIRADWYFDVISPFAYLHFKEMQRRGPAVTRIAKPVLFAGLLKHWGNIGPAELAPKRRFIYEFCTWYGLAHGIPFVVPAAHPFNPLRYLRLILACDCSEPVIEAVFETIFTTGTEPEAESTWNALCRRLSIDDAEHLIARSDARERLRSNTEEAIAAGVFGVPTLRLAGRTFWGLDALPMLDGFLADPKLFEQPQMQRIETVRFGAVR